MKIKVDQTKLCSLVSKVQGVCENRSTMPMLSNFLLDASENGVLKILATNLEVSFTSQIEASVEKPGKVVVNARNFFKMIKELLPEIIEIETGENDWIKVYQNKSKFNIVGLNPNEYPAFPHFKTKDFFKVKASEFFEMIQKTLFSVSDDETRYHLNGVYLKKTNPSELKMVSTDGHRLSLVKRKMESISENDLATDGVIIPRKGLNEIKKLIELNQETFQIAIEGCQLIILQEETILLVRLIEGQFPMYQKLIPESFSKKAIFNREKLLSSLRRISVLSDEKSRGVTINLLSDGVAKISSSESKMGNAREEIEVDYKGEDVKINFNVQYILDILNQIKEETVDMKVNDEISPGIISPHDSKDYTCLIMPMRS